MTEITKKENLDIKKMRFVEVEWLDAAVENHWVSIHGEDDIDVAKCISRGWIMKQDDKQVVLCATVGFDKDGLVEEGNATIAIPCAMIQSVVDFPHRKQRKPKKSVAKVQPPKEPSNG